MGIFRIDVGDFQWINGPEDDPQDLCLHGHVSMQIGNTVFEEDGTISATALYLLKTLTEGMAEVILSHDSAAVLYSVPSEVAANLEQYCMDFAANWIWHGTI